MAIYRFRVGFEDYDDIYRDIEIKSSQTFKDFHTAIQVAIGFDGKHAASFLLVTINGAKEQKLHCWKKI